MKVIATQIQILKNRSKKNKENKKREKIGKYEGTVSHMWETVCLKICFEKTYNYM